MLNPKKTEDQTKVPIENEVERESDPSDSANYSSNEQITDVSQQVSENESHDTNSNNSLETLIPINKQESENELILKCRSLPIISTGRNGNQRQQQDKNVDRKGDELQQETEAANEQELQIKTDVQGSERSTKYVSSDVTHDIEPQNTSIPENEDVDKRTLIKGKHGQQPEGILPFTNILSLMHAETENEDEAEKRARGMPLSKDNEYQVLKSTEYKHVQQPEEKSDPNINSFEVEEEERRIELGRVSNEKSFESHLPEITKRPEQSQTIIHNNKITTLAPNKDTHKQNSVVRKYYKSANVTPSVKENLELGTIYSMYTVYSVPSSQIIENKPEEDIPVSNESGNYRQTIVINEEEEPPQNETSETIDLTEQDKISNENQSLQQRKRSPSKWNRRSTFAHRGQQEPPSKRQSLSNSSRNSFSNVSENTVNRAPTSFYKQRQSAMPHSVTKDLKLSINLSEVAAQRRESIANKLLERHGLSRQGTSTIFRPSVSLTRGQGFSNFGIPHTKKRESISSVSKVAKKSIIGNNQISSKPRNNESIQNKLSKIEQSHISQYEEINVRASRATGIPKKKVTIDTEFQNKIGERKGAPLSRGEQIRKDSRASNRTKSSTSSQHHSFQHPGKSMGPDDFKLVTRKLRQYAKDERRNSLLQKMGLDQPFLLVNTRPNTGPKSNGNEITRSKQIQSSVTKNSDDQKGKRFSFDVGKVNKQSFYNSFPKSQEKNIPPNKNDQKQHGSFPLIARMDSYFGEKNSRESNLQNTSDIKRRLSVKPGQGNLITEAQVPVLRGNIQSRTVSNAKAKKT